MAVSRRFMALLLASAVCAPSVICMPAALAAGPADLGGIQELKLERRWSAQAVLNVRRDNIVWMANDEDIVFVQSSGGVLTALNAENGHKLWTRQLGRTNEVSSGAVSNSQFVLVTTGPVLYAMDKFTGDELFTYRLPTQPSGPINLGDDNRFYVPMSNGSVYGYNLTTLLHRERFGELPPGEPRAFQWRFICNETIRFAPVIGKQNVAFGTDNGNIHGVDPGPGGATLGQTNFEFIMRSPVSAPLTMVRRNEAEFCLTATREGRLFCMMLNENGRMRWSMSLARPIEERMVAIGNDLYASTLGDGMHSILLSEGTPRYTEQGPWVNREARLPIAVSRDAVYAMDYSNRLLRINRKTSKTEARVELQEYSIAISNNLTDRVYLATSTGNVICLAETGTDFATYHQNPARQPIIPEVPETEPAPPAAADDADAQ